MFRAVGRGGCSVSVVALERIALIRNLCTSRGSSSTGLLDQFFDSPDNWGQHNLRPKSLPGRAWSADELRLKSNSDLHKLWFVSLFFVDMKWSADELRLKSNSDLHKLWYVLLKERNMLLTMQAAYEKKARGLPNPERLDRVEESMKNMEEVVHERNDACLLLETGEGASPPERTVTSFMGFTYRKRSTEHLSPPTTPTEKEYEVPYLDDDAYMMQRLWNEKEQWKKRNAHDDASREARLTDSDLKHRRTSRQKFNCVEQLPEYDFEKSSLKKKG